MVLRLRALKTSIHFGEFGRDAIFFLKTSMIVLEGKVFRTGGSCHSLKLLQSIKGGYM